MKLDRTTIVGMALVAIAAAVLTFTTLFQLAVSAGYDERLAWLLPIAVDAAGLVALRVWLQRGTSFAKGLTLACIVLSVAGNATQHGLAAYGLPMPWWVIVIVSAVPPSVLAAVVHLGHRVARTDDAGPDPQADRPTEDVIAEPVRQTVLLPAPGPDHLVPELVSSVPRTDPEVGPSDPGPDQTEDDDLLPEVVRWAGQPGTGPVTRNAVMRQFKVGTGRATKLVEQLARQPVTVP